MKQDKIDKIMKAVIENTTVSNTRYITWKNKKMTELHILLHNDDIYFVYETTGEEFLKTLTREQLLWGLDEPEELTEKTDKELIELLAQEDLQEIYGTDIEDFYYADAEQEYNEMQQAIADEKWERDRDRL